MKRLIILVGALLIFLMLLSLLLPQSVSVAKSVTVNAPSDRIINTAGDFKSWPHWFPVLKENLATLDIRSEDDAIIKRENGKNIEVHFLEKAKDSVVFTTAIASGASQTYVLHVAPLTNGGVRTDLVVSTKFNWYPWQRARTLFMDKLTGPQYEEALKNLRAWCEQDGF